MAENALKPHIAPRQLEIRVADSHGANVEERFSLGNARRREVVSEPGGFAVAIDPSHLNHFLSGARAPTPRIAFPPKYQNLLAELKAWGYTHSLDSPPTMLAT